MNMDDIFSQFGDVFGGHFGGGGFGGGGRGGRRVNRGSNLRVKVKMTLEEIANGVEKKIKVKKIKYQSEIAQMVEHALLIQNNQVQVPPLPCCSVL